MVQRATCSTELRADGGLIQEAESPLCHYRSSTFLRSVDDGALTRGSVVAWEHLRGRMSKLISYTELGGELWNTYGSR